MLSTSISCISFKKCGLMMQCTRNLRQGILLSSGFKIFVNCNRCRDTLSRIKEKCGVIDHRSFLPPKDRMDNMVSFLMTTHLTCSEQTSDEISNFSSDRLGAFHTAQEVMVAVAALHHLVCQDRSMFYLQLFLGPHQRQFLRQNSFRDFQGKRREIESNKAKG